MDTAEYVVIFESELANLDKIFEMLEENFDTRCITKNVICLMIPRVDDTPIALDEIKNALKNLLGKKARFCLIDANVICAHNFPC